MTSKTMLRTGLVTAGALAATLLAGSAAQAASAADERRNLGMQRMHELMQEGNPGMQRMHQLMQENGGMHMGAATR